MVDCILNLHLPKYVPVEPVQITCVPSLVQIDCLVQERHNSIAKALVSSFLHWPIEIMACHQRPLWRCHYIVQCRYNTVDFQLTHWGRVTHICVGNWTIIGSDNGLSPGRRQAIIETNAGILLIGPLGANTSEILIAIEIFSFKNMCLKMSSGKCWPFCFGLNVLKYSNEHPIAPPGGEVLGVCGEFIVLCSTLGTV